MSQKVIGVIGEGAVVLEIIEQGLELGHVLKAVSNSANILNSKPTLLVCQNKLGSAYLRETLEECDAVILSLAGNRKLNPDAVSGLEKLFNEATVPWYILLDRFEHLPFFLHPEPRYVQQEKHFELAERLHNSKSTSTVVIVPKLLKDDPCFSQKIVHEAEIVKNDALCIPNLAYFLLKDIEANVVNASDLARASLKERKALENSGNINPQKRSRWFGLKQVS